VLSAEEDDDKSGAQPRRGRAHVRWEARDPLGGNGILLDFHVVRHMADIEAIHTYEGTETIQTLIVGKDITGVGAFG
jgi:alkylation response protein AidB-like acyl-CoA dehydrogenase